MIVREVLENPDQVLEKFDWLNDSKDTWQWITSTHFRADERVIPVLKKMIAACPENWLHWMVYR